MRPTILIAFIFICLSLSVTGQNSNNYKFIYKFQLDNSLESSLITSTLDTLQNMPNVNIVRGYIKNNKSKPISFTTVTLKSNDTTLATVTNDKGYFEIKIKPSIYDITISGVGYSTLNQHLNISERGNLNFKIVLGSTPSLVWYNIHSAKELTNDEINEIKKCVQNCNGKLDKCKKKNLYFIMMEI